MGLRDIFRRTPLSPEVLGELSATMKYKKEWRCGCGANLRIRSKAAHSNKGSNYTVYPVGHAKTGQSMIPPEQLTWDGLAEERGWIVGEETVCPACQMGMSVEEYKTHMRSRRG